MVDGQQSWQALLALQGATSAARESYEESLAVRRQEGDAWGMSWVLFRLGVLATWECRFTRAAALLEESLQQSATIRFGQGTLLAQLGLGETLHASGDDRDATGRFTDALATARDLNENSGAGVALAGLSGVALASGDLDSAARWLNEPEGHGWRPAACRRHSGLVVAGESISRCGQRRQRVGRGRCPSKPSDCQQVGENRAIIEELEVVAIDALRQGRTGRAATLLAAAAQWRTVMGFPIPPRDGQAVNDDPVLTSADAGPDSSWLMGQGPGLDDAVTLALDASHDTR